MAKKKQTARISTGGMAHVRYMSSPTVNNPTSDPARDGDGDGDSSDNDGSSVADASKTMTEKAQATASKANGEEGPLDPSESNKRSVESSGLISGPGPAKRRCASPVRLPPPKVKTRARKKVFAFYKKGQYGVVNGCIIQSVDGEQVATVDDLFLHAICCGIAKPSTEVLELRALGDSCYVVRKFGVYFDKFIKNLDDEEWTDDRNSIKVAVLPA